MDDNCACVKSEFDKKRLKTTLKRYKEIKGDPNCITELDHLFAQLCCYSEADFKEVGEEAPRELRRALGKIGSN